MPPVAERNGVLPASPKRYGNENATKASEKSSLYLLPPPAAITTYCLPVFFPRNVIGVACPLAGSITDNSSFPLPLSNARKRRSSVAPIKTNPPAVTIDPPMFAVPVGGRPFASNTSTTPNTVRHRNSPLSRSMAVKCPQGGFWHGYRVWSQKRELGVPKPRGRYGISEP